jgi:hypothetical protein
VLDFIQEGTKTNNHTPASAANIRPPESEVKFIPIKI